MNRRIFTLVLAVALMAGLPALSQADLMTFVAPATVQGRLKDISGTEYLQIKWMDATLDPASSNNWWFNFESLNLSDFMGSTPASEGVFAPDPSVYTGGNYFELDFQVGLFNSSPSAKYYEESPSFTGGEYVSPNTVGLSGSIRLTSLEFASTYLYGDTINLTGTLENLVVSNSDFSGYSDGLAFNFSIVKISNTNTGADNFITKYNTPGANDVNIKGLVGGSIGVVTPEPGTWLLFGSAIAGLAVYRRRRAFKR
jgi:hypothetical protein